MSTYKEILEKLYEEKGVSEKFNKEYKYLTDSIDKINSLWEQNYSKDELEEINLIIFGEAPLWGKKKKRKSYIYNPKFKKNRSFFLLFLLQ